MERRKSSGKQLPQNQTLKTGDPGKIRTSDTQFRKLLLYPPELRGHASSVPYPSRAQDRSQGLLACTHKRPLCEVGERRKHTQAEWAKNLSDRIGSRRICAAACNGAQ